MITRLTQEYKITCDRCGKETFSDELERGHDYHRVSFVADYPHLATKTHDVCSACYKDFIELSQCFFDEVNKDE